MLSGRKANRIRREMLLADLSACTTPIIRWSCLKAFMLRSMVLTISRLWPRKMRFMLASSLKRKV
ncbi:putative mannose-1-phosphate guanylyltransferase [Brucella abortus]|nr:putative mannose-1-phosphate guanylyltransferase [Brucella abortus]